MLLQQGCRAQSPEPISPELARKIAVTIRTKSSLPYNWDVSVGDRKPSTFAGYDQITATFSSPDNSPQTMTFLLSKDGKSLAQFTSFDMTHDLRDMVAEDGRPSRGGPENAPVRVIVFDDLQCPFCARMHNQLFPAILARYGDKVRVVYKDYPLSSIHAWASHAAVDADCLAAQSNTGFWNLVDTVHGGLQNIGKDTQAQTSESKPDTQDAATARAKADLDRLTIDEGKKQKVDLPKLNACVAKQDETSLRVAVKAADPLNINGAPMLFINGLRIEGAVPVEYVWKAIDDALRAQGITPPPPASAPTPAPSGR